MNQSAGDELEYQELLILAYFKANYKRYEFNEIIHIMGMTYEEMIGKIDNLLEKIFSKYKELYCNIKDRREYFKD